MSDSIEFVDGLFYKEPRAGAPDYVKGSISIQPAKLTAWLAQHQGEEWVNVDVKESRGGKIYCAVNDWKPVKRDERAPSKPVKDCPQPERDDFQDDSIPF